MNDFVLIISVLGLILASSIAMLLSLKQHATSFETISRDTQEYFENFNPNTAKEITLDVETKLIDLSSLNKLEKEISDKFDNLMLNLKELSQEVYSRSIKNMPTEFFPEVEKFEKQRTITKKKDAFKILTFNQDTMLPLLQQKIRDYEKLSQSYSSIRNTISYHKLWLDRYLQEDSINPRIENIKSVDYNSLIAQAKISFEHELKVFKEKINSQDIASNSSIDNLYLTKVSEAEEKVNQAVESVKFFEEKAKS